MLGFAFIGFDLGMLARALTFNGTDLLYVFANRINPEVNVVV